jgi:cytochrome c oxidase accessory protein FixG
MAGKERKKLSFRYKRNVFFVFVALFTWFIPWVIVDGNHFFLLSFDHKKLDLFFISFSMQELYMLPFILMILFIGIFGLTLVAGRAFCGWACPQTMFRVALRDLIETTIFKLRRSYKNKQKEVDYSKTKNKVKKGVIVLLSFILAGFASANFMWFFVPPEEFFTYLVNWQDHPVFIGFHVAIALFLVWDIVVLKENFCIYVCPYSRIQSVLYDDDTLMAVYDYNRGGVIYDHKDKIVTDAKQLEAENECTTCEACVRVCPTHIDIRQGLQLECINCLECVDACTTVMGKLGKPTLVEWSSARQTELKQGKTRFFRPSVIAYGVVLVGLVIGALIAGSTKEYLQLNINKETRPFKLEKVDTSVRISNIYSFLFENTETEDHRYYFEVRKRVTDADGSERYVKDENYIVKRPSEPFKIKANRTRKKAVVIEAKNLLTKDDGSSLVTPIKIFAYALEDKERIIIDRDTVFAYPSKKRYEELLNQK